MNRYEKVIEYVKDITNSVVTLDVQHVYKISKILNNESYPTGRIFKFSGLSNNYELCIAVPLQEDHYEFLRTYEENTLGFFRFEIYNENGIHINTFHTTSAEIDYIINIKSKNK